MPRRKVNAAVGHSSIIYEMEVKCPTIASRKLDSNSIFDKGRKTISSAQLSSAQGFKP
jgi:hypothetical protein